MSAGVLKAEETRTSTSRIVGRQSHALRFAKVLEARQQPTRALWMRNGRYRGQLKVGNPINAIKKTRRISISTTAGIISFPWIVSPLEPSSKDQV